MKPEIIEAAMRVLDRSPAAALSLRMAAGEAGVTPTSAYKHFPNAKALMADVLRECWRQLGEEMSQATRQGEVDAFASLKAQMGAYVRYAMERPSRYRLLFALEPLDFGPAVDLPGPVQPAYRRVLASIERMTAEGRPMPMKDLHASTLLTLSIAHGRIALAQTSPRRRVNSAAGVQDFVLEALERLFKA